MRKLMFFSYLLAVYFCIPITTFSQTLSLSEIVTIHQSTDSVRQKMLISKGFELAESAMKELNGAIIPTDYYTWTDKNKPFAPVQTMIVIRNPHPRSKKKMETSYILFSQDLYRSLKLNAWELGYKHVKEEKDKENIAVICQNKFFWLRFFEDKYPDNIVYGVTIEDK